MRAVLAVELRKLLALRRMRAAFAVVLVAPPVVAAVLQLQQGLPTDTLYGRWVQDLGLAFPLVLLGSAGVWTIPILAGLVAGDVLSSEDAHGTWATLLTRSCSRWELFWGKALVAAGATVVLVLVLGTSAIVSGLLFVGRQDLVGLSGQPIAFPSALALVALAWLSTLPAALAVSAGALLVSAATRSSLLGVGVPALAAGGLGLAGQLAPLGGVRPLLVVTGLGDWHGLLLEDPALGPLEAAWAAALVAVVVLLAGAVLLLRRRDWAVP